MKVVVVVKVVQKTMEEVVDDVYVCDFVRALRVSPKLSWNDLFYPPASEASRGVY